MTDAKADRPKEELESVVEELRDGLHVERGCSNWLQAVTTGVAAVLCYWLTRLIGLEQGYWAAISTIVVMQSEVGATVSASRDRLVGTAIGALIGWITALVWRDHILVFGAAVVVALILCNLLGLKSAGRLAGVTVVITVLIKLPEPVWKMALDRFLEVSFGILVALGISLLVYPRRKHVHPTG